MNLTRIDLMDQRRSRSEAPAFDPDWNEWKGAKEMPESTIYERDARERKCMKLASYIHSRAIAMVEAMDDEQWKHAASAAGVNLPSAESRERIKEILKSLRPVTLAGWGNI